MLRPLSYSAKLVELAFDVNIRSSCEETMKLSAMICTVVVGLIATGCSSDCQVPSAAASSNCHKPVYPGPRCLELHPAVKQWLETTNENIFNCHPAAPSSSCK